MPSVRLRRRSHRAAVVGSCLLLVAAGVAEGQTVGGDVSASVPEAGARALTGALAGATVEPSSGVLRASLAIALPSSRGAAQPALGLTYSSAAGIRDAGVGWGLALPVIERSTRAGAPRLDDEDELSFNGERLLPICEVGSTSMRCDPGAEPLPSWARTGWRYFRLETDNHARFFWSPDRLTWRVQLHGGEVLELGRPLTAALSAGGSLANPDAGIDFDEINKLRGRWVEVNGNGLRFPEPVQFETLLYGRAPFRWNLVRRYDPPSYGPLPHNLIAYRWARIGSTGRGYLTDVYYSPAVRDWPPQTGRLAVIATTSFAHHVHVRWQFIPQAGNRYTPMWRATADHTIAGIDVASKPLEDVAAPRELVRRYHLTYKGNQRAYLSTFQLEGRCPDPVAEVAEEFPGTGCPRMSASVLRWSEPVRDARAVELVAEPPFPANPPAGWQLVPLDVNADGLPDLVENNPAFAPDAEDASGSYAAAQAPAPRKAYVSSGDDRTFKESRLDGPAALLSRFGATVLGDFAATGDTGAVLFFPALTRKCGIVPGSPCGPWYGVMSGTAFDIERVGNTAGGSSYAWRPSPLRVAGWALLSNLEIYGQATLRLPVDDFQVEVIGDVNGDGVPDLVDVHTDPEELTADPLADIRVRFGARRPEETPNGGFASPSWSCVGPAMEELREYHWLPWLDPFDPMREALPVAMADMNGDSLGDLVAVGAGTVKYWPGDGRGNFSACRGTGCGCSRSAIRAPGSPMLAPVLGLVTQRGGWRLAELNGDGYADLVAVGDDGLRVYFNVDGFMFEEPLFVSADELFQDDWEAVRQDVGALKTAFADMNGNGLTDLVLQIGGRVVVLDLHGGATPPAGAAAYAPRPGLLIGIDNGLGARTEVAYATTAELAKRALSGGRRWSAPFPQVMQVVERMTTSTNVPGDQPVQVVYAYEDPSWDGYERRFRGFGEVTTTRLGSPRVDVSTTYLVPACPQRQCWSKDADFRRLRAATGSPLVTETFDEAGRYLATVARSYDIKEAAVARDGLPVGFAYPFRVDTRVYDTNDSQSPGEPGLVEVRFGDRPALSVARVPVRSRANVLLRTTQTMDTFGNVLSAVDHGRIQDDGTPIDDPIRAVSRFLPPRADWKFLVERSTTEPFPDRPQVPTDHRRITTYAYDSAGRLSEVKAWLSGTLPLDRRHQTPGAAVAPAPVGASSNDTWVSLARYRYDAFDNVVEERGPSGRCSGYTYDPGFAQLLTTVAEYKSGCGSLATDFNALRIGRRWDRGFEVPLEVTAVNGTTTRTRYDGFGRPLAVWLPDPETGQLTEQPWMVLVHDDVPGGPAQRVMAKYHDAPGRSRTVWSYLDGFARRLLTLTEADPAAGDAGAWVGTGLPPLGPDRVPVGSYEPWFYDGDPRFHPLTPPAAALTTVARDAFGRMTEARRPDGSLARRYVHRPLAMETYDAAGRAATVTVDGHGREVEWTQQTGSTGGALGTAGQAVVSTTYQVGGEPARVVQGTSDSPLTVTRWTRHDSLGRMTLNAEPNTASGFDPDPSRAGSMRAWRYAYDDAGALVGTSDARGCGENLHYDSLGRLRGEDFSPCLAEHAAYSPITLANGAGAESFYRYDALEPSQAEDFGVAPANLRGRLVATMDQAAHVRLAYDWRGRQTGLASRIARPSDAAGVWPDGGGDPGDRFGNAWFRRSLRYDNSGRVVAASTGAASPELMGADGGSNIELTYGDRGLPIAVGGSYGALVERVEYDADEKPRYVRHGDAASTAATYTYDLNRRPTSSMVFRGSPALWTAGTPVYEPPSAEDLPTLQQLVLWSSFRYDATGMLERVEDLRNDVDWPEGARPVTQAYAYDRATRLVRADYLRAAADPSVAFAEAGRAVPSAVLPERVGFQSFSYDARGNLQSSEDDARARYDRSLGRSRFGPNRAGPDQLRGSGDGTVAAAYDEAGNLVNLTVVRAGPCADAAGRCSHRFVYDWDEIGRLARARRWDYTAIPADDPAYPVLAAVQNRGEMADSEVGGPEYGLGVGRSVGSAPVGPIRKAGERPYRTGRVGRSPRR